MKTFFITCYADYLGYSVAFFKYENSELTLLKLHHSDLVSNANVLKVLQDLILYLKKQYGVSPNGFRLYINDNQILYKYLSRNLYESLVIRKTEFELEETLYILSSSINEGQFLITKEVASQNIVREIKSIDLQVVNHKVYSLLIAVKEIQSGNGVGMFCYTTGKIIKPNEADSRDRHPFGNPYRTDIRSIKF